MSNNCNTCKQLNTQGVYNHHKVSTSQYSNNGMSMGCYSEQKKPQCNWHRKEYIPFIFPQTCGPTSCTQTFTTPSSNGVKTITRPREWIDDYLVNNFLFGDRVVDSNLGISTFSAIPQYLINSCPDQTPPNSNGRKVGPQFCNEEGNWQAFIKVVGQSAYLYIKNCETNETIDIGDWEWGIADCAIKSVSADKILDWCNLFAKATIPIDEYKDYNGCFNEEMFITSPVTLTDDCKLTNVIAKSDIRKAVIPYLDNCKGEPLYDYNPITDAKPVFRAGALNGCIGVRVDKETVIGQNDPTADYAGTDANPLKSKAYVVGHDDPEELEGYLVGDGTPEKPLDIKENSIDDSRVAICTGGLTTRSINYDDKIFSLWSKVENPSFRSKNISVKSTEVVYEDNQAGFNKRASWRVVVTVDLPETGCDDKAWLCTFSAGTSHAISTIRDASGNPINVDYRLSAHTQQGGHLYDYASPFTFSGGRMILGTDVRYSSGDDEARNYASSTGYRLNASDQYLLPSGTADILLSVSAIFPNSIDNPATDVFRHDKGLMNTPDKWFREMYFNFSLAGLTTI